MSDLRVRPGDQPLPVPASGPGMHDLVIAGLVPERGHAERRLAEELRNRRDVGLRRYGSLLQVGNGRNALRDLLEECLDGIVYARQAEMEGLLDGGYVEGRLRAAAMFVLGVIDEGPARRPTLAYPCQTEM